MATSTKQARKQAAPVGVAAQAVKRSGSLELALRRAEKSAGSTKHALSGAGARRNPPTPERKKALSEKLAREVALVRKLREERDAARKASAGS